MKRGERLVATGAAGAILLAGCSGESLPAPERAPAAIEQEIGSAALKGVWIVPYGVQFDDDTMVERSFARVNGNLACDTVGEQRESTIEMLYAVNPDESAIVQFVPPSSPVKIEANIEEITEKTMQCVRFNPKDADKFVNDVPVSGVFPSGEYSFVVQPNE